jgi:YHS domain-containing protein
MKRIDVLMLILAVLMAGCSGRTNAAGEGAQASKGKKVAKRAPVPLVKCPVMGGGVDKQLVTEYKGAKLYFCCPPCIARFTKDPTKYATEANEQLVATGQAKQAKCPLSGDPIDATSPKFVVDGITVSVARAAFLKELEELVEQEQRERLFNDEAFARAFVIKGGPRK